MERFHVSCVAAVSTTVTFDPRFKAIRFLYIVQCIFIIRKSLKTSFDLMFFP